VVVDVSALLILQERVVTISKVDIIVRHIIDEVTNDESKQNWVGYPNTKGFVHQGPDWAANDQSGNGPILIFQKC